MARLTPTLLAQAPKRTGRLRYATFARTATKHRHYNR